MEGRRGQRRSSPVLFSLFVVVACLLKARTILAASFFEVEIETSEQNVAYTTNETPVFAVNFNAKNLTVVNPLKLFEISGSNRVDVVYSQSLGVMYVMAAVENTTAPGTVVLTVNEGVTSSQQGGANSYAQLQLEYVPYSQQGNAIADIAGWGMLGGLALSLGATLFSPASTIGVGAINFAGFVQTFYMSGNLPITNMPNNYRSSTSGLVADWVLLNPPVGPAVQDNTAKEYEKVEAIRVLQDMSVKMPYPPVMITFDSADDIVAMNDTVGIDRVEDIGVNDGGAPPSSAPPPAAEPTANVEIVKNDTTAATTTTTIGTKRDTEGTNVENDDTANKQLETQQQPTNIINNAIKEKNASTQMTQPEETAPKETQPKDRTTPEPPPEQQQPGNTNRPNIPEEKPPMKPPVVKPIPDEELNDADGKPPNPFKPPPKGPPGDDEEGESEEGESEDSFVEPLMGDDDGQKNPKPKPKPKPPPSGDGPFVEPLMGDDGGKNDKNDEDERVKEDDTIDLDYYYPKLPWLVIDDSEPNLPDDLSSLDDSGSVGGGSRRRRSLASLASKNTVQARRQLLLADPISSLGSSGFSYVIVTATSGNVTGNTTMDSSSEDAIGASILSRIRAIEVLGGTPTDAQRLDVLWNVLFWSSILLAGVFAIHLIILGVLRLLNVRHIPKMLHAPRVELLTFTMILPMIAAAGAAALRSDSAGAIVAGVCFGILLPFGFLIGASAFLVYAVFRPTVSKRRAVYVLSEESPMFFMPSDEQIAAIRRRAGESGEAREAASTDSESESDDTVDVMNGMNGGQAPAKGSFLYRRVLSPLFGFDSPNRAAHVPGDANISECDAHLQWLGRGKMDGDFVKRYGLFFEDAHGPQVVRVRSRYEWSNTAEADAEERNTVGGAILVASVEGAMEILQTFAIVFAATKMVLFAVIINAPGGVNHFAQVIALALVSLFHIAYLRVCVPYRLRVELMAEIVAAVMDLAVFVCGIILVAVPEWSAAARDRMGLAMIVLQAIGFLVFITVRLALAIRTCWGMFRFKKIVGIGLLSRKRKGQVTTNSGSDGSMSFK